MDIEKQIKNIMQEKNISSYKIAKDLQISEAQLSKFFNGKVNMSLNKLLKIINYLDCKILIISKDA